MSARGKFNTIHNRYRLFNESAPELAGKAGEFKQSRQSWLSEDTTSRFSTDTTRNPSGLMWGISEKIRKPQKRMAPRSKFEPRV